MRLVLLKRFYHQKLVGLLKGVSDDAQPLENTPV